MQYIRRRPQSSVPDRTERSPYHNMCLKTLMNTPKADQGINIKKRMIVRWPVLYSSQMILFLCVHCTRFGKQFWKHCFVQRTVRWASSDPSFVPRNMVTTSRVLSTTMLIENVKTIAEFFSKNFLSYYEFPSILKNLNKNLDWRASKFNKFGKFLRFSVL